MNPNKLDWANCPKCKILINDYRCYSMDMLMCDHQYFHTIKCPACEHRFMSRLIVLWKFVTSEEEARQILDGRDEDGN